MKKILFAFLILVIAVTAFLAGDRYGNDQIGAPANETEPRILYYTDPMNPGFRSEKPGTAPCGMPLEPVYAEAGEGKRVVSGGLAQSSGAVRINPGRQQLIGLQVSPVEFQPMTYILQLYGRIIPDETRIFRINASTDSWVRALSDVTTGSIVKKDQILAEALAPAFYNAQVTFLVALNNIDRIREQLAGEVRHQQTELADNQVRVAVQALQNLGITDAQIEELANTRKAQPLMQVRSPANGVVLNRDLTLYQWFKAGEEFYEIADLGRVWVYADVYEDEARHIIPGMEVMVKHKQMGKVFDSKVSQVLPLFDPVAKTLKVRLDVDNLNYDLRPDMFVDVEIPITIPSSLHVEADAVIDSGIQKIVYVDIGNSTFEPRRVETGWRLGRRIEITDGLMAGEKVVVSGNFLVDSESRMKTAAAGIPGPRSKDPVCGMYVDNELARISGLTAAYGDKTYYFCMAECRENFKKEPEKHLQALEIDVRHAHPTTMQVKNKGWLELLEPGRDNPQAESAGTHNRLDMKGSIGSPATFPGIVDWDGPDPGEKGKPPRDWSGWGKFPGAKYLGLKDSDKKASAQKDDMPDARYSRDLGDEQDRPDTVPESASHTDHSSMNAEMHEQPPAAEPEQPARP